MCVHMCACIYTHTYVCAQVYKYIPISVYMCTYVPTFSSVCNALSLSLFYSRTSRDAGIGHSTDEELGAGDVCQRPREGGQRILAPRTGLQSVRALSLSQPRRPWVDPAWVPFKVNQCG